MFRTVSRTRVEELLTQPVQIVEVLDAGQFRWAHLPGAVHLAAGEMTAERVASILDPARPTVVYSRDHLCDLSPRAACLLDLYGFSEVYHYAGGKAEWLAFGLPVEGEAGSFASTEAAPMPTLPWDYTVGDARIRLGDRWPEEHPGH
ncbi:MAG: rhodanese-like domain-containing protein, partial [Acidimicrobiales bacterium]